jgi:hypothetical protein
MKKLLIGISLVSILAFGTLAFAQDVGGWGSGHMTASNNGGHMTVSNNSGHMMGRGYGGHMNGTGYGGHMGGPAGHMYEEDQTFLNDTADLRKELHAKRFEYAEVTRDQNTTVGTIRALESEIYDLERKINDKAPVTRGYGANL